MPDFGPHKNNEGYADPTAYHGIKNATQSEKDQDRRVSTLIGAIKGLIDLAGYDLLNRIEVRDRRTGREYR